MRDNVITSPELVTTRLTTVSTSMPDQKRPLEIKTILAPVDFSQESLRALEYVTSLARKFGATIHVLHVRPSREATAIEHAGNLMLNYTDVLDFLQDRLADIQRRQGVEFSPEQRHVASGRPFEEICKLARQLDADLIALPTRGQSGFKRVLLGSTAERVIRYAPCPVLILRGKTYKAAITNLSKKTEFAIRKILVPVDFSECSIAGVKYANFMAEKFKATLHLFHALHPYAEFATQDRMSAHLLSEIEAAELAARNEMTEIKRRHVSRGVACELEMRTGNTVDLICDQSEWPGIDLIVTSTHGRTGFRHALIGSVAEHVARYADCPVIIVPSKHRTSI